MVHNSLKIALFQPDIPQNAGAMIRLCACLGMELDVIEPCGFLWDTRKLGETALDYLEKTPIIRHKNWESFFDQYQGHRRIILMTTKAQDRYTDFTFRADDILLAGRESAGVPEDVRTRADAEVYIQMQGGIRSLNIVCAAAMIAGEAIRQTRN